jgi:hypothetical protein
MDATTDLTQLAAEVEEMATTDPADLPERAARLAETLNSVLDSLDEDPAP